MVLRKRIGDYGEFWGVAEIKLRKVYPMGDEICTSENYPDCSVVEIYSKNTDKLPASSNFVSLCRKENFNGEVYAKCELAKLFVSGEDKT